MAHLPRRLAWGLALTLLAPGWPLPALAATPDWSRVQSLVDHQAYRLATEELRPAVSVLLGEDRHQALYWLGYSQRRLGDGAFRTTLGQIPRFSLWYPRAQRELAAALRLENQDVAADELLYRLGDLLTGTERELAWVELAESLFERGKFRDAQELYLRELQEGRAAEPRERAAYALGWCYERMGNPARAIWSWKEALRLFPLSPRGVGARLVLSNQYLKLGKPLLAADELQAVARQTGDPELEARARFVAGEGYAAVGNWAQARAAYQAVKPGTRWSEPAEYAQAYARWQAGDARGARPELERWLTRYASSSVRPAAHYVLGRVQLELGDVAAGYAAFEAATQPGRSSYAELARFGMAELDYNQGRLAACADQARKLLAEYPETAQRGPARWLLAEALLGLKQYPEAIAVYRALAEREGDLAFLEGKGDAVTFRLGLALFRAGDFTGAASYLRDVSSSRYGEEALYWLAEASYRTEEYAAAQELYARFQQRYPGAARVSLAAYGEAYSAYQLKAYDRALRQFKLAAPGLPDELRQDALMRLAALQLNAHDWAGAATTYSGLYTSKLKAEHLPDVLHGLIWATYRKGDVAGAATHATSFLERFPEHPRVARVRLIAGQAMFRQARYADAAKLFQAVATDERSAAEERLEARGRLGACYYNAKQYLEAVAVYDELFRSSHGTEREGYAQLLAQARLAQGDLDGAFQVVTEHASASSWAGDVLGRIAEGYLSRSQAAAAVKALDAIEAPTPEQRYLLYQAHRAAGNPEAALAALDAVARLAGPRQAELLAELAESHLGASDPARAREAYALLATVAPKHPSLLTGSLAIAAAYLQSGAEVLALEAYRDVVKRFGGKKDVAAAAAMKVGQLELKRGNHTEAAVAYRAAEVACGAGTPGAMQARYWLGYTMVEARRYEDAARELEKLRVPPGVGKEWQALAWLKQGEAYEHLRRWKEATQLYQQLIGNKQLPAAERAEAGERLRWIETNVSRRTP